MTDQGLWSIRLIDIQEYLLLKGVEAVAIHGSKSPFLFPLFCFGSDVEHPLYMVFQPRTSESTRSVRSSLVPKT